GVAATGPGHPDARILADHGRREAQGRKQLSLRFQHECVRGPVARLRRNDVLVRYRDPLLEIIELGILICLPPFAAYGGVARLGGLPALAPGIPAGYRLLELRG